jgi:hypothetical protein
MLTTKKNLPKVWGFSIHQDGFPYWYVTTIYVELSIIVVLPTYFTKPTSLQPTCKQLANNLQTTCNQLANSALQHSPTMSDTSAHTKRMRVEGEGGGGGSKEDMKQGGGECEEDLQQGGGGSKDDSQHGGGGPGLDDAPTGGETKVRLAFELRAF